MLTASNEPVERVMSTLLLIRCLVYFSVFGIISCNVIYCKSAITSILRTHVVRRFTVKKVRIGHITECHKSTVPLCMIATVTHNARGGWVAEFPAHNA